MTAFCTLCGNTAPGDLGATIGICLNADACHRRQVRMREHRQYVAEQIAREIEDIICTPEAACGDRDCRQPLADAATARNIGGVTVPETPEAASSVAAALEGSPLPGMPSPSPVPAGTPTAASAPAAPSREHLRQLVRDAIDAGTWATPEPTERVMETVAGPLLDRVEAAEAKLSAITELARSWASSAAANEWSGTLLSITVLADAGRSILAITGTEEEARDG